MVEKNKNQLIEIVNNRGLEQSKARYILENFQNYFDLADEWANKARSIIVNNEEQIAEMKMAREGRLFLSKKRNDVEKARKKLKEQALREGKAIDGIANVLKSLIIPIEEYLERQEKFIEIKREKEEEAKRIEIEKRMDEERIEKEMLDNIERDRYIQAVQYKQFWKIDKPNFRDMSDDTFTKVMDALIKRRNLYEEEQKEIRAENIRMKKEADEREAKRIQDEKERQKKEDEQLKIQQEKERKERETHEAQLRKEREETRKRQEEIEAKAKKEAEERRKLEEQLKNQIECPKCRHKFQIERKS